MKLSIRRVLQGCLALFMSAETVPTVAAVEESPSSEVSIPSSIATNTDNQRPTEDLSAESQAIPSPEVSIRWSGSSRCRKEADLAEHLRRLIGSNSLRAPGTPLAVTLSVTDGPHEFNLELSSESRSGLATRAMTVATCDEVAQSAALVISVWFEEYVVAAAAKTQESEMPTLAKSEVGANETRPIPADLAGVGPSQLRLLRRAFALGQRKPHRLALELGPVLVFGVLPEQSVGLRGAVGTTLAGVHLQLQGLWLKEQSTWQDLPPKIGGRFGLLAGGLRAGRPLWLSTEINVEPGLWLLLGRLSSEGLRVDKITSTTGDWGAAGLSTRIVVAPGRISVGLELACGLPFGRPRFLVDETVLFQSPRALGFAGLWAGIGFL